MARVFNETTIRILKDLAEKPEITPKDLYQFYKKDFNYKDFYNTLFRLADQELITKEKALGLSLLTLTPDGYKLLQRLNPERDGVWKILIFDIPEKQKYIRTILRTKLKSLFFKKWQNSIWISPYKLEKEIEDELNELAKKYFIRLIKTTEINFTEDLEKMFSE